MKGFAVATGSNTHTAPNYRLPVNAKTHDPLCYNEHCLAAIAKEARAVGRSDIYRLCKNQMSFIRKRNRVEFEDRSLN